MKALRVRWTPRARDELFEIGEHIARDKPGAARAWVERLVTCAEEAALAPKAHRRVPEVKRDEIREALLSGYRIVYQVTAKEIRVLTVFEGHLRLNASTLESDDDRDR